MPAPRRSMAPAASPLKTISNNLPPPVTPGTKVVALKAELEKKDVENEALRNSIAELTNALSGLNVVKDKIDTDGTTTGVVAAAPKSKKDKDAPVHSKTAYKFWSDAHPKTKEGVNMQQVWKECSPEIRQSYEAMAKADKARYLRELATYQEEKAALEVYYGKKKQDMAMEFFDAHVTAQAVLDKVDAGNKKGKKKAKKDPEAPKRPLSSYMYFVSKKRESVTEKNPNMAPTEAIKTLGEMWGQLEKGKKGKKGTKKYEDLATEDRARYEGEKKVYDAMIEERNKQSDQEKLERLSKDKEEAMELMKRRQDAASASASVMAASSEATKMVSLEDMSVVSELTNNNKPKKVKKVKDPNAPKGKSSAYIYFSCDNRNQVKASMPEGTTQKDILTEVGRQWKELSEEKKEKYVTMANKDKERYAEEMEKYTAEKK